MALPRTVFSGFAHRYPIGNGGPYYYNGYHYAFIGGLGITRAIRNSVQNNPDSTWVEQDGTNRPVTTDTRDELGWLDSKRVGDVVHVVTYNHDAGTPYTNVRIIYGEFDLSTNSWVTANEEEWANYVNLEMDCPHISLTVASNGEIFVAYSGEYDSVKGDQKFRVDYSHYNGSTWSHANALDAAGDVHYGTPVTAIGHQAGDAHFIWVRQTNSANDPPTSWGDIQGCTWDESAGSLTTTQTSGSLGSATGLHGLYQAWTNDVDENIIVYALYNSDARLYEALAPTPQNTISTISNTGWTLGSPSPAIPTLTLNQHFTSGMFTYDSTQNALHTYYHPSGTSSYVNTVELNSAADNWNAWPSNSTEDGTHFAFNGVALNVFVRGTDVVLGILQTPGADCEYYEIVVGSTGSATVEGAHTFSINADQTEVGIKTISAAITYLNNLYQNQDKQVSIEEALSFIIQVAQQEVGDIIIPLEVDLNMATNFILQNILTGEKSITIGALLDQFSQKNLQTYQQTLFDINLSNVFVGSAAAEIEGVVSFGSTLAYLSNSIGNFSRSANISVVLDKASQVYRLFEESTNFSFTLNFDPDYLSAAVFDDPYYGSPDNYIFVDLTKIALISGAIKSASITFTTSQGQTQTVGLIGQAAQTLVMQLIQNQVANKVTSAQNTLSTVLDTTALTDVLKYVQFDTTLNLDKLSSVQENALKAISYLTNLSQDQALTTTTNKALNLSTLLDFNTLSQVIAALNSNFGITLDQTSVNTLIQLAEFSATLNVDELSDKQIDALKTANYLITQSQNQAVTATAEKTLNLSTILDFNTLNQLVSSVNVDFAVTLDFIKTASADTTAAIAFLTSLDFITEGDTSIEVITNFNINLFKTNQIQSILNTTLTLISNVSEAANKQAIVDKAIQYLIQLSSSFSSDEGLVGAVSFIMQMQEVDTVNLTADKAAAIIIQLAKQNNVHLTTAESLALIIQLADSYSTTRTTPAQFTLNTSMQQLQSTLVDKLITISFALALDHISTSRVDFNAFSTLISAFTASFLGDAAGTISAFVTFASQISQANTSISVYNKNVTLDSILSEDGISNLDWYKSLNVTLQLGQTQEWDLGLVGAVIFNTFYSKLASSRSDFRPSIDFNLQAIEAPQATKDMLANALLSMEESIRVNGNVGIVSLVDFGLQQGFETDLRLTAEGEVQLTTQLSESTAIQYLGQVGITIGHLLGLTALSRAGFAENVTFGTISDLSVDGFVLKFTLTLPEGRTLRVYFEDRIKIIDEEGREIKVYSDFRTDPTIN